MGHLERKKRDQENIRSGILNAAINLAKSDGWNAVTIRKIAEAIEYTPPIVYEYFKNKDDLIREIIIYGFYKLRQMGENNLSKTSKPKKNCWHYHWFIGTSRMNIANCINSCLVWKDHFRTMKLRRVLFS